MVFSDTSTETGIVQEVNDICQSDNNNYPIESKTRRANAAMDRFFTIAFEADGRWAFDDINQTTVPLESINLVSGTEKYALDTFTSEIIKVLRVEILTSAGLGIKLEKLDESQAGGDSLAQYNNTAGQPAYYRLFGKFIYLYPKPNYNSTSGLTLLFERNKSEFVYTDTTKEPGIPSIFHPYICRMTALPYLIEFQKPQKNDIGAQIQQDEAAIRKYFGRRDEGERKRMTMRYISHR